MWSAATVLTCALSMLGRSERHFHPINLVDTPPVEVSANAEGYATRNPDTINVVTSSPVFQEALRAHQHCGARRAIAKLASILEHEEWHLRHGADERTAYQTQLTTLRVLGFDEHTAVYWSVKKAMLHVLEAERRRRSPAAVLASSQPVTPLR
jgi:hypothetical protein